MLRSLFAATVVAPQSPPICRCACSTRISSSPLAHYSNGSGNWKFPFNKHVCTLGYAHNRECCLCARYHYHVNWVFFSFAVGHPCDICQTTAETSKHSKLHHVFSMWVETTNTPDTAPQQISNGKNAPLPKLVTSCQWSIAQLPLLIFTYSVSML